MQELMRTNEPALLSFVESLLRGAKIHYQIADQHVRAMEGSIDIFPKRLLVLAEDYDLARKLLIDAGLSKALP